VTHPVSRLFISHSSRNDDWALALQAWLIREGWSGENDIFLDLDPERGIVAGQRWARALEDAATRCEAVLFLVSGVWLGSKWCSDEYQFASRLNKKLFALLIDDITLDNLPGGLTAQWQVVHLKGDPAERFLTVHPRTQHQSPVHIAEAALKSLKRGLTKAGIGPETFELEPDASGQFGWRAPYRGLEALEPEDAAVFFGRSADIVRGIDALRGLAARRPPRLLVVLGASGAGKSSFLRAGLWPRLARDDSQWLPLRAIRAGRGGAIEGSEGLLHALEDVNRRFALRASRADLRQRLATPESFVALLKELREAAARRALISAPPQPLPVLCLDQGEELFAADAGPESEKLLRLARAAIDADAALLLVTIRSDAYGLMQSASTLAGVEQATLSLGPVPQGEIARIIREPSEVLRRKAGPSAPNFDAAVVERLQREIAGETDALPLLAFVLQRLMREHTGTSTIGVKELDQTGGVAAAIEQEAESALADAGFGPDRAERREVLRRLFIPRLARIDRDTKAPQRRVARQSDLAADLLSLARALTQRRLVVAKLASEATAGGDAATFDTGAATLEVAHEALLRRWPTLAELMSEDRDALLLLDGVLTAAVDWDKAESARKTDFLAHRGSRLSDAQALASRGADWAREIVPAQAYLTACTQREITEREEKEAALAREQERLAEIAAGQARTARLQRITRWAFAAVGAVILIAGGLVGWLQWDKARQLANKEVALAESKQQLDHAQANVLAELSAIQLLRGDLDGALRAASRGTNIDLALPVAAGGASPASAALATAVSQTKWSHGLGGHDSFVSSAEFSPDGLRIVTASGDKTVRIWDATSAKELAVLRGHESAVRSAAFSPDGSRIVTASADNTARIWDAASAEQTAVLRGHAGPVHSATFSPDGSRVITASEDKTARIWEVASAKELAMLRGHEGAVQSATFTRDGSRIVTTSEDKTARIWDAAAAKEVAVLRGHDGSVASAAFSPDGRRIVTASYDKTARVWDAAAASEVAVLRGHGSPVQSAAFSPDGSRIVTASWDKTVRIWEAASARESAVLRGHSNYVYCAKFSPDGLRIVTASWDRTARVWDAPTAGESAVLRHEGDVWFATFSPDGSRIVTTSGDKTARIWDSTGNQLTVLRGHNDIVLSAAFTPDGSRLVTASWDKTARIWDVAAGKEIAVLYGHGGPVASATFSPDGTRVVTASADKTIRIWEAATATEIVTLRGHENYVMSAAFSPDGSRLVTASWDRTARIWDARAEKEIAILRGHSDVVWSAAFSRDGLRIVTASTDKTARIWDAASAHELVVLRGHDGPVRSAAFRADGSRIVTSSEDNTARIWEAATAKEIGVLRGHDKYVVSAVFGPDGSRVITASWDGTARVWDANLHKMSAKELLARACARLAGVTKLSRAEMRLAGYPDNMPEIDVCKE
jgi:WD40 repeat protein